MVQWAAKISRLPLFVADMFPALGFQPLSILSEHLTLSGFDETALWESWSKDTRFRFGKLTAVDLLGFCVWPGTHSLGVVLAEHGSMHADPQKMLQKRCQQAQSMGVFRPIPTSLELFSASADEHFWTDRSLTRCPFVVYARCKC